MVVNRSIVKCILLSIITCGIYGLVWFVNITDDVAKLSGDSEFKGSTSLVLTLVTCGIYGYFWAYKLGKNIDIIKQRKGENSSNSPIIFLILQIFGLGIVNYALAQDELNKYAQPTM